MIYLMRHGADPSDRYGGWSAFGLTEEGRAQVLNARGDLLGKNIQRIYASDLERAKETAEIVAEALALTITYLPQFRESNNGLLAGMLKTEAAEKYPGIYWNNQNWTEPWPGGESPREFFSTYSKRLVRIQRAGWTRQCLAGIPRRRDEYHSVPGKGDPIYQQRNPFSNQGCADREDRSLKP